MPFFYRRQSGMAKRSSGGRNVMEARRRKEGSPPRKAWHQYRYVTFEGKKQFFNLNSDRGLIVTTSFVYIYITIFTVDYF